MRRQVSDTAANTGSPTSRRTILLSLAGGAVAAGTLTIAGGGLGGAPGPSSSGGSSGATSGGTADSLATAEMDAWAARTGSVFQTNTGSELRLSGIVPLPSKGARPAALRDRAFLAVFDVVSGAAVAGGLIYRVATAGSDPFDIHLDQAGVPEFPARMHAVFN